MRVDKMSSNENRWDIVNGAQLPRFVGKKISICGLVTDVSTSSFNIRSCDNIIVSIQLPRPLDQPVEGYVEVFGRSQGKSVLADDYKIFSNKEFDVRAHNALCTFLYQVPNLFQCS